MEVIQPTEYAAFFCDVETAVELTSDGGYHDPGTESSCLIFESLELAEEYCRRKVETIPNLHCEIFDSHGRANPPVTTIVNQVHESRLESDAKAGRMMQGAFLTIAVSIPFFWYTLQTQGEAWIASFFGIQMVLIGLRLLHWSYSMREELHYRRAQSDLRRQQIITRAGRS